MYILEAAKFFKEQSQIELFFPECLKWIYQKRSYAMCGQIFNKIPSEIKDNTGYL